MWTNRDMIEAVVAIIFSISAVMIMHYLIT